MAREDWLVVGVLVSLFAQLLFNWYTLKRQDRVEGEIRKMWVLVNKLWEGESVDRWGRGR